MDVKYQSLPTDESHDVSGRPSTGPKRVKSAGLPFVTLILFLLASLSFNVWQHAELVNRAGKSRPDPVNTAGLQDRILVNITAKGPWWQEDQALEDEAWNAPDLTFHNALVALDDDWAMERGIPLSQRWPWDENKGIYFVDAVHDVHCLQILRKVVLEAYAGKPMSAVVEHPKHCLQTLLQSAMCHADDTLRYTGNIYANHGKKLAPSGEGQQRTCHDWKKLHEWIDRNSACYEPDIDIDLDGDLTRQYKFCPDGSKPWLNKRS